MESMMNMSTPAASGLTPGTVHQQNLDLFTFVLDCVAKGDLGRLNRAGLKEQDVSHLRSLSFSQLMELSDRGVRLSTYLSSANRSVEQAGLCNALIERRAPRELMMQLFRMSTRRYAAERTRLGIAGGRGRPSINLQDSSLEHRIWRLWVLFADPVNPAWLSSPDQWLLISMEVPGHLRTAWSLSQRWCRDRASLKAFEGDRIRLSESARKNAELDLRARHKAAMDETLRRHIKLIQPMVNGYSLRALAATHAPLPRVPGRKGAPLAV